MGQLRMKSKKAGVLSWRRKDGWKSRWLKKLLRLEGKNEFGSAVNKERKKTEKVETEDTWYGNLLSFRDNLLSFRRKLLSFRGKLLSFRGNLLSFRGNLHPTEKNLKPTEKKLKPIEKKIETNWKKIETNWKSSDQRLWSDGLTQYL